MDTQIKISKCWHKRWKECGSNNIKLNMLVKKRNSLKPLYKILLKLKPSSLLLIKLTVKYASQPMHHKKIKFFIVIIATKVSINNVTEWMILMKIQIQNIIVMHVSIS